MNFQIGSAQQEPYGAYPSMDQSFYAPGLSNPTMGESSTDASARTVYVGNVHPMATEAHLTEMFSTVGPIESCKLIRKEKTSFGFVEYYNHSCASTAISSFNGKSLLGFNLKVNWAFVGGQREDTSALFTIFVGDLSHEVSDELLGASFSIYPGFVEARVMKDNLTRRSRGFGFVSFRTQPEAERAMLEMHGQWVGNRAIRCNWATKSTQASAAAPAPLSMPMEVQTTEYKGYYDSSSQNQLDAQTGFPQSFPTSQPQNTTVYVGNLGPETSEYEVQQEFSSLGVGTVEDVRIQKEKGFGFVRFSSHQEAARAIQAGDGRLIHNSPIKCSWGNRKKYVGPGPVPGPGQGYSFQGGQGAVYGYGGAGYGSSGAQYAAQSQSLVGFPPNNGVLPGLPSNFPNHYGSYGASNQQY